MDSSPQGTLTVKAVQDDGRVICNLATPDGPPTWIQIFNDVEAAKTWAKENGVDYRDEYGEAN